MHGVKGERNKYTPIQSILTSSTIPLDVATAFKDQFSIKELYIADLDAIMFQKSAFSYLEEIIRQTDLGIMLDAGIDYTTSAQELLKRGVAKVIIGTETLQSINNLQEILSVISPKNLIVSLDLKLGKILTKERELKSMAPINAVRRFEDLGIQELIILELTKVGSETGVMTEILRDILQTTSLSVITGGGAKTIKDLKVLQNAGVSGVLIATALHKGTITPQDLTSL